MNNQPVEKEYNIKSLELSLWTKIIRLMSSQKKNIISLLLLHLVLAVIDISFPYLSKITIDKFVGQGYIDEQIIFYIAMNMVLIVLLSVSVYLLFIFAGRIEMNFSYELRQQTFEKLHTLSFSYFDKTPIGWLIARVTTDITRLSEITSWGMMRLISAIITIIGSIIVMLLVNWQLALWIIGSVPILFMITHWFQSRILNHSREVRKLNSTITSDFNEGISGAKASKSMALEDVNFNEFCKDTEMMKVASIKSMVFSSMFMPTIILVSSVVLGGILYTGGNLVLLETIQYGTMVMFFQYAVMFFHPLREISQILSELQMGQANAERILDLLETTSSIQDTEEVIEKYGTILNPKPDAYEPMCGDVEFRNVSFHYIEEEPVLKEFNLKIKAGSSVALVGETGSGKSTIVNLLCRFYEPISGEILIDGKDYKNRSLGWLRSNLGYVLQSPHLFSGTIEENLRFGNPEATLDEIKEACKLVHAHEFIMNFENGYATEVGEGGNKLSTGQKQLISFARAILANPTLFVLDEATSSIDAETERVIQYAIDQVLSKRTSFIIAHRLSTIVNASIILVIDKGEVIESGSHEELMTKQGRYYKLYTNQFNEELENKLLKRGC